MKASSQTVDFGDTSPQNAPQRSLILHNSSSTAIAVRSIAHSDYIRLAQTKNLDNKHDLVFAVSLDIPPTGQLHETVKLLTSLPQRPEIEITVQGNVRSKWVQSRPDLYIGFVNIGERREAAVDLHGITPSQIVSATSNRHDIPSHVRITQIEDGSRVTLSEDYSHALAGPMNNSVLIRTTDGQQQWIRLPVTGMIEDPNHPRCCSK